MLTQRELEIVDLVTLGDTNQMIASRLGLAFYTVQTHVSNIFDKLGLSSRLQVALWRLSRGNDENHRRI